jgi:hypothetical protein
MYNCNSFFLPNLIVVRTEPLYNYRWTLLLESRSTSYQCCHLMRTQNTHRRTCSFPGPNTTWYIHILCRTVGLSQEFLHTWNITYNPLKLWRSCVYSSCGIQIVCTLFRYRRIWNYQAIGWHQSRRHSTVPKSEHRDDGVRQNYHIVFRLCILNYGIYNNITICAAYSAMDRRCVVNKY